MKKYYLFIAGLVIFCLAAAATQTIMAINPSHDSKIASDISTIRSSVGSYTIEMRVLPTALTDLDLPNGELKSHLSDYEYRKVKYDSYDLCAIFKTNTTNRKSKYYYDGSTPEPDVHPKGRACFTYKEYGVTPPPLAITPSVSICGQYYKAGAIEETQKIVAIDPINKKLTTTPQKSTAVFADNQLVSWSVDPVVYESSCLVRKTADLKVGDVVTIYLGTGPNTIVAIVRQKPSA